MVARTFPTALKARMRRLVRDERGASIVMALVFFLICAIIGSVVLTAASVGAKEVHTHKELQQAELAVGSAAQAVAHELESMRLTCGPTETSAPVPDETYLAMGLAFWTDHGEDIMKARKANASSTYPITLEATDGATPLVDDVHGRLTVDADLNIAVELSLDAALSVDSPYNMIVTLQCVPAYDGSGRLVSFAYEPAVVKKAGGAA